VIIKVFNHLSYPAIFSSSTKAIQLKKMKSKRKKVPLILRPQKIGRDKKLELTKCKREANTIRKIELGVLRAKLNK